MSTDVAVLTRNGCIEGRCTRRTRTSQPQFQQVIVVKVPNNVGLHTRNQHSYVQSGSKGESLQIESLWPLVGIGIGNMNRNMASTSGWYSANDWRTGMSEYPTLTDVGVVLKL